MHREILVQEYMSRFLFDPGFLKAKGDNTFFASGGTDVEGSLKEFQALVVRVCSHRRRQSTSIDVDCQLLSKGLSVAHDMSA